MQIGARFWDTIIQEHAFYNTNGIYDDSMSSFFRNLDSKGRTLSPGDDRKINSLRARVFFIRTTLIMQAVLIDMEEGVLSQIKRSPISGMFDAEQYISSVSGSGNNWAVGFSEYGGEYRERILDSIRMQAERCDALQSFFTIHSLGGGTGSGLGSFITELLCDEYPQVLRFSNVGFPSKDDDVVISPYNSVLSLSSLIEASDCVMPVDNDSLINIYNKIQASGVHRTSLTSQSVDGKRKSRAYDAMNNIVANLMVNTTSSMRFEGVLNVDINDIATNLVPFPRLKFLTSSMTPLATSINLKQIPTIDQLFNDAFSKDSQLTSYVPVSGTYLGCAVISRGAVELSDIRRNVDKWRKNLKFVEWNEEAWKVGLCSVPPANQIHSLLTLANNTAISSSIKSIHERYTKLFKRKANLHHYTKYLDVDFMKDCSRNVLDLIRELEDMQR